MFFFLDVCFFFYSHWVILVNIRKTRLLYNLCLTRKYTISCFFIQLFSLVWVTWVVIFLSDHWTVRPLCFLRRKWQLNCFSMCSLEKKVSTAVFSTRRSTKPPSIKFILHHSCSWTTFERASTTYVTAGKLADESCSTESSTSQRRPIK